MEHPDGEHIEYYENGKVHIKCNYKNGELDGKYLEYFEWGQIFMECYYLNGQKHGNEILYTGDGEISAESNYKNGKLDGKSIEYDDITHDITHDISHEINYKNGVKHGKSVFYKNGCIESIENYVDGKFDGMQLEYNWFGEVEKELNYIDGKPYGNIYAWYGKGKKAFESKIPTEIGDKCYFYFEDGNIKCENTLLSWDSQNDELRWLWKIYYPNGKLQLEFESIGGPVCYQDGYICDDLGRFEGILFGKINIKARDSSYIATDDADDYGFEDKDYDENAVYHGRYDEDNGFYIRDVFYTWLYDGKYIEYYEGGQIKREADYKDGKLEGECITYSEDGKKENICSYHNSVKI